jgi:SRSO17 transposase
MERRYRTRLEELRQDAIVDARVLHDMQPRLEAFVQPFLASFLTGAPQQNVQHYVAGLVADLEDKNVESIAYLHDEDRQILQKFIGQADWDHQPLVQELARQIGRELGEPDGVLVFDPSGFPKKGDASVGVQRQWCGRLGKIDNCQVGVYLAYVSRREHALVDMRLFLPKLWAGDRRRRKRAGVPKAIRFQTRHELALQMLDEHGAVLPHQWIAGDDEMGRSTRFRQALREREERYLLCVPSNTLIRDLQAPPPPYRGRGPRPQPPWPRADVWAAAQPAAVWHTVDVRDGAKGPLVVQVVAVRVRARTERRSGPEETLVVFRARQEDGAWKYDYTLSNAPADTPLPEWARVFKAEHRIEECLQRAKGEAGLADYEVRTWQGWHHHQVLSLIATWFLTQETRRGKKIHAGVDGAASALGAGSAAAPSARLRQPPAPPFDDDAPNAAQRRSAFLSPQEA